MNDSASVTSDAKAVSGGWRARLCAGDFQYIVTIFLLSRLGIFFLGYMANLRIEKFKYYQKMGHWLDPFFQWDAYYYLAIARDGYAYTPGTPSSVNFFPLYPLLVKLLSFVCADMVVSGFLVSNLALLIACFYLYRIAMLCCKDQAVARFTVAAVLVFPTNFFLSGYYAESLFVATAAASFCYALERRWAAACICAFLSGLTRQLGMLMIAPLVIEFFRVDWGHWRPDTRDIRQWPWLLLAPCGVPAYMAYLYWRFDDPFAFAQSAASWGRYLVMPWETLVTSFHSYSLFDCFLFGGAIGIVIVSLVGMVVHRLPISGLVLTLLMLGVILTMRILDSSQRYVLHIFPMYLALGRMVARRDGIRFGVGMLSVLLLSLFIILFVSGYRMF